MLSSFLALPSVLDAQTRGRGAGGGQEEREPDDRLPPKLERRVRELIVEGRPDDVATLLADQPKMYRVHSARAFAQTSLQVKDARERERQLGRAVREYEDALSLQGDAGWFLGVRRHFDVAQWRVELGDLILRRWVAADMDRYEITSGLDFDRERVTRRLRLALESYASAGRLLDELSAGLEQDEDKYLLLGVAGKIIPLREQQRLNSAWASLYLAITAGPASQEHNDLLATSIDAFDAASRNAKQADRKYNALLGAGIALYHSKRLAEAEAVFDRIIRSTSPQPLIARAYFEKARALVQAEQFDEARDELETLKAIPESRLQGADAGAAFYVRLAPLMLAQTHLLEAKSKGRNYPAERRALEERGCAALARISEQGGIWPEIVQAYLDAYAGAKRAVGDLTDTELRIKAEHLMGGKNYAAAIPVLKLAIDRPGSDEAKTQARFNLGVCLFQTQDLRSAAEAFAAVIQAAPTGDMAERAVEYAYHCWRQVAHDSQNVEDYRRLAELCELIRNRFARHKLATEAAWVGALARQEAGDIDQALAAYAKVPRTSDHYWIARRNVARCKQAAYEVAISSSSPPRRRRAAEEAQDAWSTLAEDLTAALAETRKSLDGTGPTASQPSAVKTNVREGGAALPGLPGFAGTAEVREWIAEAKLAAAAAIVCDDLRGYAEGLRILADLPLNGRVLALRLRCHRGLGDLRSANEAIEEFIRGSSGAPEDAADRAASRPESGTAGNTAESSEPGAVLAALVGLAAEMEKETARLKSVGRPAEAARMAGDTAETIAQLLEWIQKQPDYQQHVPAVRYSLVKALAEADRPGEAVPYIEQLMIEKPDDGEYVLMAARLQEALGRGAAGASPPTAKTEALARAEAYWEQLLRDEALRERAPDAYWEARYHWLEHQLRRGHAADVLKAIDTEKAWYPDLGGPPWQAKFLDLAKRAEAAGPNP
jgi:tetratricopeptide (TPR) repeat protein